MTTFRITSAEVHELLQLKIPPLIAVTGEEQFWRNPELRSTTISLLVAALADVGANLARRYDTPTPRRADQ